MSIKKIEQFAIWLRKVYEGDVLRVIGNNDDIFGFCMAFSQDIFKEVGGFDPRFGLGYFEDTDYNKRIKRAGLSLAVDMGTFVEHGGVAGSSVSFNQYPKEATVAKIQNAWKYAVKWNGFIEVPTKLIRGLLQGRDWHSVTDEIVETAQEKDLWG